MKKILIFLMFFTVGSCFAQWNARQSSDLTTRFALKLNLAGGTMTGSLRLGDLDTVSVGASNDFSFYHSGGNSFLKGSGPFYFHITDSNPFYFFTSGSVRWVLDASGDFYPSGNYDIGSETYDVDSLFVGDIKLNGTAITASASDINKTVWLDDSTTNQRTDINANSVAINNINTNNGTQIEDSIDAQTHRTSLVIRAPYVGAAPYHVQLSPAGDRTVTKVTGVVKGGTSVTFTVDRGANILSATENVLSSSSVTSAQGTATNLTSNLDAAGKDVPDESYVWITVTAVVGSVETMTIILSHIGG